MELSLILMVWNTSHLLKRTLRTLQKQTIEHSWELIIVDDSSEDDVYQAIEECGVGLPIVYVPLKHKMGMRGNMVSINTGVDHARGRIVMWSTPEVMLPPDALKSVCAMHSMSGRQWVTIPSHGLTSDVQLKIDTVDWETDIHNIKSLVEDLLEEDWASVWFNLNFYRHGRPSLGHKSVYGNNQTVAVKKEVWLDTLKSFPLFLDYGSDDPWVLNKRRAYGFTDITLWDQEAYHQWHPTIQYWMAQGKAPNWNKHGHTISNVADDPHVPAGGTCQIWDGGDKSPMGEEDIRNGLQQHDLVIATGFRRKQDAT